MFWYFQFQWLISDFSDNPLKLHKIPAYYLTTAQNSCLLPQIFSNRDICLPICKKSEICPFWGKWDYISTRYSKNKKAQKKGGKKPKKKGGKKKEKKCSDKKVPCPPHTPLLSTSHHRS